MPGARADGVEPTWHGRVKSPESGRSTLPTVLEYYNLYVRDEFRATLVVVRDSNKKRKRVELRDIRVTACKNLGKRCKSCILLCRYVVGLRSYLNEGTAPRGYEYTLVKKCLG